MELDRVKSERQREILKVLRIRMVHENADDADKCRKLFDNLRGARCIDAARAARIKVQADGVGSEQNRVAGVFNAGDAADLDPRHDKPRMAAAGSADVSRCSPIRNASAPAPSSSSTSSREWIPLSTTNSRSSGIMRASRTEV